MCLQSAVHRPLLGVFIEYCPESPSAVDEMTSGSGRTFSETRQSTAGAFDFGDRQHWASRKVTTYKHIFGLLD